MARDLGGKRLYNEYGLPVESQSIMNKPQPSYQQVVLPLTTHSEPHNHYSNSGNDILRTKDLITSSPSRVPSVTPQINRNSEHYSRILNKFVNTPN